jgi:hypothetical protein
MSTTIMNWINKQKAGQTTITQQGNNNVISIGIAMTAYVNKVGEDGWVLIRVHRNQKKYAICKYTKLTLMSLNDKHDRVVFKIEEGPLKGEIASMIIKNGIDKFISETPPAKFVPTIKVKYGKFVKNWYSQPRNQYLDQQMATLMVGNISVKVTLNSDWNPNNGRTPLAEGVYEIAIPDHEHNLEMTNFYKIGGKVVPNYGIWFPILPKSEQRYIHIGHLSHGCISIIDYEKYSQIHDYLIQHRGKGTSGQDIVAILEVTK